MTFKKGHVPWSKGKKLPSVSRKMRGNRNWDHPNARAKWFKKEVYQCHGFKKGNIPWNKGKNVSGMTGRHHTEKTKKKMSAALKGRKITEEWKQKMSEAEKGRIPWNKGKRNPYSEEIIEIMKARHWSKQGLKSPFYGKHHSEKAKEELRQARLRQVFPIEDTKIEVLMQKELQNRGVPFRTHIPIVGQPDIFIEPDICIFCDGEYWHNRPDAKERDERINKTLRKLGYYVFRFWEHEIKEDVEGCFDAILEVFSIGQVTLGIIKPTKEGYVV